MTKFESGSGAREFAYTTFSAELDDGPAVPENSAVPPDLAVPKSLAVPGDPTVPSILTVILSRCFARTRFHKFVVLPQCWIRPTQNEHIALSFSSGALSKYF